MLAVFFYLPLTAKKHTHQADSLASQKFQVEKTKPRDWLLWYRVEVSTNFCQHLGMLQRMTHVPGPWMELLGAGFALPRPSCHRTNSR